MALTRQGSARRARALLLVSVANVALVGCASRSLDALTIDPESLSRGLVAHWTFDAVSGTTVADSSGNAYDGMVSGGNWIPTGRFDGALALASGDAVTVPAFPQAAASWTVSVWLRTSRAQLATATTDWSTIISNEIQFSGGWEIHLDNRPEYQRFDAAYWVAATNDYIRVFCSCLEADRWIHLTTVWDAASAKMTLYQDDRAVDETAMPSPIRTGDANLTMGKWTQAGRHLAADLDDFAIWRRALQATEIAALSARSAGP